jgi:hydrogenase maturation protein HypF
MGNILNVSEQEVIRSRIAIEGIVQGVGFRPFIYGLAKSHRLNGYVLNNPQGVLIEVEGAQVNLEKFIKEIPEKLPSQARIVGLKEERLPPFSFTDFEIRESTSQLKRTGLISPDLAICGKCLKELFSPEDRRYRYPFINCTNCGPRYTIIDDIPYDRPFTSMKSFRMCPECQEEYDDPSNRRFHAQPNACRQCGPEVMLVDSHNETVAGADPVTRAVELLSQGSILAIKGLGGFHLAVDATNDSAVRRLRELKLREEKPFAVMSPGPDVIRTFAKLSPEDEGLLQSPVHPIVLLAKSEGFPLSSMVAPRNPFIGVMLPYTPLHHLLFEGKCSALVMTSGNLKDEPIAIENREAVKRLRKSADYFLMHNRDIYLRSDDSVVRPYVIEGKREALITRRSRGYIPLPVFVQEEMVPLLAVGGEMKNTICLTRGKTAFLSQHIGEMGYRDTYNFFLKTIAHMKRILEIEPRAIACDLHPDYAGTRYAASQKELPVFKVQHHHAHIASCMAENGIKNKVIGVAFDGTGYGPDRTVWGGEFLLADLLSFRRVAHLATLPLPGGEQAIREPWRMALSYLATFSDCNSDDLDVIKKRSEREKDIIYNLIRSRFNSPLTSSMGRFFDAVSALIGICEKSTFEGQAAMELEMVMGNPCDERYPFIYQQDEGCITIDPSPLIKGLLSDLKKGSPSEYISSKFHQSIVTMVVEVCCLLRKQWGVDSVALSGGCFQNIYLLTQSITGLRKEGFEVFYHQKVPPNDGGISLGQAVVATELFKNHSRGEKCA